MISLKEKILHCLKIQPQTRNSDISLTNFIWLEYHRHKLFQNGRGDWCVKIKDLYDLPSQDDCKRWRAKIQNHPTNPRFLPTDLRIAKQRKINEELWRSVMGYNKELRTLAHYEKYDGTKN